MATPRSGKPRGRPKKERPPKRAVGRPQLPLNADRDRYSIALLDALTRHLGMEARPAARLAAAFTYGVKVQPERDDKKFARLAGLADTTLGFVAIQFGRDEYSGARATTLEGRADSLREKLRRPQAGEKARWLRAMGDALALTLTARTPARHYHVALIVEQIGEKPFYEAVLRPMIDENLRTKIITPADISAEMEDFFKMAGSR